MSELTLILLPVRYELEFSLGFGLQTRVLQTASCLEHSQEDHSTHHQRRLCEFLRIGKINKALKPRSTWRVRIMAMNFIPSLS